MHPGTTQPAFTRLRFGSFQPQGWLVARMQRDLEQGFTGCLDRLVPDLFADDIYGRDRLGPGSARKELGLAEVDRVWEAQYLWWNSETRSNWLDGFVRTALLAGGPAERGRAASLVRALLASQDTDGYLGIHQPELRFPESGENGELWALATAGRVLLGWHEATGDQAALAAVEAACRRVMATWPAGASRPFAGPGYAGLAHGLAVTDVFRRLSELGRGPEFVAYAAFLYADYGRHTTPEADIQPASLTAPGKPFSGHSVHTYEHLRALLAARAAGAAVGGHPATAGFDRLVAAWLAKLEPCLCPSGAGIGDEWIKPDGADTAATGYEYCGLVELFDSWSRLLEDSGDLAVGDRLEALFLNAALGARHPDGRGIAYLAADTLTSLNGMPEIRCKQSPVHQDAAVCCAPNAGRLFPGWCQAAWAALSPDAAGVPGLAAVLYGPGRLATRLGGTALAIAVETDFPLNWTVRLTIDAPRPLRFRLALRRPAWADGFDLRLNGDGLPAAPEGAASHPVIDRVWQPGEMLEVRFEPRLREGRDRQGRITAYDGPLLLCLPLPHREHVGRSWPVEGFFDRFYDCAAPELLELAMVPGSLRREADGGVTAEFRPAGEEGTLANAARRIRLVPLDGTILRLAAFQPV